MEQGTAANLNVATEARESRRLRGATREWRLLSALRGIPLPPALILAAVVLVAIFANLLAPHSAVKVNVIDAIIPPFWTKDGSLTYPLGTDQLGRDILSRVIMGSRISLLVGFTVVVISGAVGTTLAILAGYFGGWWDRIIMRVTDGFMALPFLVLAIAIAAVLGPSLFNMIVILAVVEWARYARILRSEVLRLRELDFIRLAKVAGASHPWIMWRHILPNVVNTLVVLATLQVGVTIIAAASLSFLGLGVPPPTADWGLMLAESRGYLATAWWMSVFPGLAIMLTVLSVNLLGDWLRLRLDPKYRQL